MNCRDLRLTRKTVRFWLAENQEKRVSAPHRSFSGIIKLGVAVTLFAQLLHTLRRACAQIIEPPENDGFSRANFGARRCEATFLPVVAEGALECAAGVGQRLWAAIDHPKWAGDNAVSAAVANIVLNKYRTDFGSYDRAGWAGFEATRFLAMLANIRKKEPAKWILAVA